MVKALVSILFLLGSSNVAAFSVPTGGEKAVASSDALGNRRSFLSTSVATIVGGTAILSQSQPSFAATAKEIITTSSGIKYAVTKESPNKKPAAPMQGESDYGVNRLFRSMQN